MTVAVPPPRRRFGRAFALLLSLFALAAIVQGLRGTGALPDIVGAARAMCEGLPDYAALAAAAPTDARIAIRVDPNEARAGERFVCARLVLAPRPVIARVEGEPSPGGAEPEYLLVDLGEGATFGAVGAIGAIGAMP